MNGDHPVDTWLKHIEHGLDLERERLDASLAAAFAENANPKNGDPTP